MPSNQRINERKAQARKREMKTKRILWGLIILIASVLIVLKVCEIDFQSIKNRFTDSKGNFTLSVTADENAYPVSLDSSKNVKVNIQNEKINVLTGVSCSVIDPTEGKTLYTFTHGYSNPEIKTAGNYFCLYDQGSNRLRLDSVNKRKIYDYQDENAILCANVSKNGNIIYATKSKSSKSTLYVKNSSLKTLLNLEVNSGYVTAVAIDSSGKRCAYAVINSKNAVLTTTVYTLNVGDKKEIKSFEYSGSDVLELRYVSSNLYVVASDSVYLISSQKKQKEVFKKGTANTVCYNFTKDGELIYVYSKYSSANENFLVHINSSGRVKTTVELKQRPKYVSSSLNEICVLFTDKVVIYSLTKGEKKETHKCDDSVSTANKLSSKVFVSRHQLIDVID